jgi:hypothetical protein
MFIVLDYGVSRAYSSNYREVQTMVIVGISGKKGVGKDLLGSYLAPYGFMRTPFAETLKSRVRRDFNLTLDHTDGALKEKPTAYVNDWSPVNGKPTDYWTPRQIMIAYGQFFRQFDPNYWINKTFEAIASSTEWLRADKFVITDVRFKNESNYIKERGGFLVRLERHPELNIYKDACMDVSETDLDDYDGFDMRLTADHNVTKKDLEQFAADIVARLGVTQHEN